MAKQNNSGKTKKNTPVKNNKPADKPQVRIVFNKESGTSGLRAFSDFITEAYNAQLTWPTVYPLYTRLRRSMPEIVTIRQAFTSWARSINIEVDLPDEPTDDDKKYKDFVDEVIADMEGGETSFLDTLVNHVPFMGFGWWEVVAGKREEGWQAPGGDTWKSQYDDGMTGIRRIAWRDPGTFFGWDFDEKKRVRGFKQNDFPNPPITIPLDKSLHITFGDPNNPEGLSPLEAVWRLERLRYGLEVVMGMGFEHSAGYLNVQKTEGGELSTEDKNAIAQAAQNILSAQEGNYAAWPVGMTGEVKDISFQAAGSLLETIRHYSLMVLSVYTMQWIGLNTLSGTGALASMQDSSQLGVFTFNAMMDGFASQFDAQVGRRLWDWNKHAFPNVTKRPVIRFSHIDKEVAMGEVGQFLSTLNGILPLGDEDYKAIRKRSGFLPEALPKPDEIRNQPQGGAGAVDEQGNPIDEAKAGEKPAPADDNDMGLTAAEYAKKNQAKNAVKAREIVQQAFDAKVRNNMLELLASGVDEFEENENSAMIAFRIPDFLREELQAKYPFIDDETKDNMHITLVYLGDARTLDMEAARDAVNIFSRSVVPFKTKMQGIARFVSDGERDPIVTTFDSPLLPRLYENICTALDMKEVPYHREHGFIPHMTLAYIDKGKRMPLDTIEPVEINFDKVYLVNGGVWESFELTIDGMDDDDGEGEREIDYSEFGGKGSGFRGHAGRDAANLRGGSIAAIDTPANIKSAKELRDIAAQLGHDPRKINAYMAHGSQFTVGNKTFTKAGEYYPETDEINIFGMVSLDQNEARGILAHEIMHSKFNSFLKTARAQMDEIKAIGLDKVIRMDGTLREGYERYWAYDLQFNYLEKSDVRDELKRTDGVTEYSKAYWEALTPYTESYYRAVDETLAEIARSEIWGEIKEGEIDDDWLELYNRIKRK